MDKQQRYKCTGSGSVRIVVIGAGGNIGSHATLLVGRMPEVRTIVLIDSGRYEAKDLRTQNIEIGDVGKAKVAVQAEKLSRIREDLDAVAVHACVEDLPLGALRADILLSCLDTRTSRQAVNERVWWLGIPWIDAGVLADGLLARVSIFDPTSDTACIECSWSDTDYALLEQRYPCSEGNRVAATNAPPELGALAGALQMLELRRCLRCRGSHQTDAHELLINAEGRRLYATALRRNPQCRFSHKCVAAQSLGFDVNLGTLANLIEMTGARDCSTLFVPGQEFAYELVCPAGCPAAAIVPHLARRLHDEIARCPHCSALRTVHGITTRPGLELRALAAELLDRTAATFGFRNGDIFTINGTYDAEARPFYEMGAPALQSAPVAASTKRCAL